MSQAIATTNGRSGIIDAMAQQYAMEPARFFATIKATVFPQGKEVTTEQAAAFLVVAKQYNLNPFIKEIYAFPGRNGGIVPIVSVDGWATLINRQEQLDGIEFADHLNENQLVAVTCRIYRKDRSHATEVTEYMNECRRDTDTWKKWPSRMLRHKALIQAARYAFGLVGIFDPDEAERITEADKPDQSFVDMPRRRSESVEAEQPAIDGEVVETQPASEPPATAKPFDEKAEIKRLQKAIKGKYDEATIERHSGGRDIHALKLDELVTLSDALEEGQR